MSQSAAEHVWNSLTFFTSLFSLVGKDWAQRWPGVKWIWPRAWDEAREAKHKTTDASSDAEGLPRTELAALEAGMKDPRTRMDRLQSGIQTRLDEEFQTRESEGKNHEEWQSRIEASLERNDLMLTELKAVVDRLNAREDAGSACCERHAVQEIAVRRYVSKAHRILD